MSPKNGQKYYIFFYFEHIVFVNFVYVKRVLVSNHLLLFLLFYVYVVSMLTFLFWRFLFFLSLSLSLSFLWLSSFHFFSLSIKWNLSLIRPKPVFTLAIYSWLSVSDYLSLFFSLANFPLPQSELPKNVSAEMIMSVCVVKGMK